jgi:8-oxo-dGTP pyrophosphatase MutT (NUDIX family)
LSHPTDFNYAQKLFLVMTQDELTAIATYRHRFGVLWEMLWTDTGVPTLPTHLSSEEEEKNIEDESVCPASTTKSHRILTYKSALAKFHQLLCGDNPSGVTLDALLEQARLHTHRYTEPEWEIPKGRSNDTGERPYHTAMREFEEETGLSRAQFVLTSASEQLQLQEDYTSFDNMSYCNRYFIVEQLSTSSELHQHHQVQLQPVEIPVAFNTRDVRLTTEVSKISWIRYPECLQRIRDYHVAKKQCLERAYAAICQHTQK